MINKSQMCAEGGNGRRQGPVMAVNTQRCNVPLSAAHELTNPGLCAFVYR